VSLRTRLLAAFAYVLGLVIVALEIPLILNVSRQVDAGGQGPGSRRGTAGRRERRGQRDDRAVLSLIAADAGRELGGRVIVVDSTGRLLADSAGLTTGSYCNRPEIQTALVRGRIAQGRRFSETLGESLLYTAVPVVQGDRRVGAVRVTQSVDAIDQRVRRDVLGLIGIGLLALALGLVFAWVLAGTLARPPQRLAETARRVEAGDLEARAEPEGSTEHREVAHAFNDMTDRLAAVLEAQRESVANASHQLRTPLTGLRLRLESASLKAGPELAAELDAAEREVEHLARLLTALLTLARAAQTDHELVVDCRGEAFLRRRPKRTSRSRSTT
jgi:signal transduction histidine kinase